MSLKRRFNISDLKVNPIIISDLKINSIITENPLEVKTVQPVVAKADLIFKPGFKLEQLDISRRRIDFTFPIFGLLKGTPASELKVPYTNNQQPVDTEIFFINDPLNGKTYLPRYKIKIQKVSDKQQLMIKLSEATEGEGGTLNIQLQYIAPPEIAAAVVDLVPAEHNVSFELRYTLSNTGYKKIVAFTEIIKTDDGYDISAHINSFLEYNQLVAAMLEGSYGCQLVIKREISFGVPFWNTQTIKNLNINPQLYYTKKEVSNINGQDFVRLYLSIKNWESFSKDLFNPAPTLPPCGNNTNSSRTWVDIFDDQGKRLYGYCAFNTNESLKDFSFAVAANQTLPVSVYITLTDREQNKVYTSNIVNLQNNPVPLTDTIAETLYTITVKEFIQEEPFHLPELIYPYIYRNTTRTAVNDGGFIQHHVVFRRIEHIYLQEELNPSNFYFLPDSFVLSRLEYPPFSPSFKTKLVGRTIEDLSAFINYEAEAYIDTDRMINAFDELQKKTGFDKDKISFAPLSITGDKLLYKLSVPGTIGFTERKDSLITLTKIIDALPAISLPIFEDLFDNLTNALTTAMLQGHVEVTILGRAQPVIIPVNLKLTEVNSEVLIIEQSKMPIFYISVVNDTVFTLQAQGLVAELQDGENILSCSKANLPLPLNLAPGEKTNFILIPKGLIQKPDNVKVILNWEGMQAKNKDDGIEPVSPVFQIEKQIFSSADLTQATNGLESSLQLDNVAGILPLPERNIPLNIKKIDAPNVIAPGEKFSFLAFLSEEVNPYDPEDFIFQWEGLKIIPNKDKLFDIIVDTSIGANYELIVKVSLFIKFKSDTTSIRLVKVEFKNKQDGPLISTIMFNGEDKLNEVSGNIEKEAVLMMPIKDYVLGDANAGQYFYRITLIKETDTLGNTEISEGEWRAKSGSLEITTNQLPIVI
ncbi:MAG: hypothetical protein ACOH2V_07905 [Candidatus Saccharimonadaceae bacterium]